MDNELQERKPERIESTYRAIHKFLLKETKPDKDKFPAGALSSREFLQYKHMVGLMMMESVLKINFSDYTESIPAFVCLIMMPLAYSISEGILLGHICYVLVNALSGQHKKVSLGMYILVALFIVKYIM